jgi:hypothetical protein
MAVLVSGGFALPANAAPYVYVVTLFQQFGTIDLADGQFTAIGNGTPDGLANLVWMPDGTLLSMATTGNHAGYLVRIRPDNGQEIVLKPITFQGQPLGFNAFSLAEVNGQLYVLDISSNLYLVNPFTGRATAVGINGGTTGLRPDTNTPFTTNADGSLNLCDEGLYGVGGELYATFDAFAFDMTPSRPVRTHEFLAPYLWRINPLTGAATFVAQTDWQISAIVEAGGRLYAFKGVLDGSADGFPLAHSEIDTVDTHTGKTSKISEVDPNLGIGIVVGAAPVKGGMY